MEQSGQQTINARIENLYQQAEKHFTQSFPRPTVQLNLRGETAGQAWPEQRLIRFNAVLFKENQQHFLEHTVAHEVAHILAYAIYGNRIKPHGPEWRRIMTDIFDVPANRCHHYDTGRASPKPHLYQCQCAEKIIPLSQTRHKRSMKGTVYLCTQCKTPLQYLSPQLSS